MTLSAAGCAQKADINQMKTIDNDEIEEAQENKVIPNTREIINTLCSDNFGGRLVGSDGDGKTEEYISGILENLKLDSIFAREYYEPYTQEVSTKYGLVDENDKSENKEVHNLVGIIKGDDSTKSVVISAHFDHIGYQDGKIIRGALDNASGIVALIRIADTLKKEAKTSKFNEDIIFAFFDGEEEAQQGSKYFINDIKGKYLNIYNINIDCVGGKQAGKISLKNKSKISDKLTEAMKEVFKENNMEFSNVELKGATSDHKSFEMSNIPNIYIGQDNLKPYVHNSTDIPDTLDFDEIDKVADVISKFVEKNDGNTFND